MRAQLLWIIVVLQMLLLACSGMQAADLPTPEEVLAKMDAVTRGIESGAGRGCTWSTRSSSPVCWSR